jgi:hypothetical protein
MRRSPLDNKEIKISKDELNDIWAPNIILYDPSMLYFSKYYNNY